MRTDGKRFSLNRAAAFCILLLLVPFSGGCVGIAPMLEQESNWQWQQYNPEYRPLHPSDRERGVTF